MGNPVPWQHDPLMDKRQSIFFKEQEINKLHRQVGNALELLNDIDLSADMRTELLSKIQTLTKNKAHVNAARDKMAAELHEAEQKMLSERASRHHHEEPKEERENKMQKSDNGSRGGRSSRGGHGGGRIH